MIIVHRPRLDAILGRTIHTATWGGEGGRRGGGGGGGGGGGLSRVTKLTPELPTDPGSI